jgi:hypothetical protein
MFIVSIGMKKSGSAYLYNIVNDLLLETGHVDARKIKDKHKLHGLMKWHNNNVGDLSFLTVARLYRINRIEGTFVVKTHEPPGITARLLNKAGNLKIIYSYRDPRDALLSATDHGRRIIADGEYHTFAKIVDFDVALKTVNSWIDIWEKCAKISNVLLLKYDDLMTNPLGCVTNILNYLELSLDDDQIQEILWKYSKNNPGGERKRLHFNKAEIYRYKEEMPLEQKNKCLDYFGKRLLDMGYTKD